MREAASAKQSATKQQSDPTISHAIGPRPPALRQSAAGRKKMPEPTMPLMPIPRQSMSVSWRLAWWCSAVDTAVQRSFCRWAIKRELDRR